VRGALTVPRAATLGYALLILYLVGIRHDDRFSALLSSLNDARVFSKSGTELLSDPTVPRLSDNYVAIPKEKT